MNEREVVLITGASRGIGESLALKFASSGYKVIINFQKEEEKALGVAAKIKNISQEAEIYKADISDPVAVKKMIKDIGKVDVLVNNAAIVKNRTVANMSEDEWDSVIKTNLSGVFYLTRECARPMIKQKNGAIINISSILGVRGLFGTANYSSAKAGVVSLTKTAALELGRFNIRVNAVLPGFHLTSMAATAKKDYEEKVKKESVLNKTTDINELSEFIVFLSRMKTVSGQVFNWDSRILA